MSAPVFVDTNVLICALDDGDVKKQERAQQWRRELWESRRGRVSFQVLEEFYVKVARKWPAARIEARAEVRDLLAWRPVAVDPGLMVQGWRLEDRYDLSFRDALIVAAAKAASCRYLLSEDFPDKQDFDGVMVVDPFAHDPDKLPSK